VRRIRRRYAVIAAGVVGITGVGIWHHYSWRFWPRPPHVDTALVGTVGPIIDRHIETSPDPDLTWETTIPRELHPRWFCTERPIETIRTGSRTRVGLDAYCQEYARRGGDLFTGGGWNAPLAVTLDRGKVVRVQQTTLNKYVSSVNRLFSERGAAEYWRRERLNKEIASPDDEALRAFGLPPGTPVGPYPPA
jgi:hypothetical protein